MSHVSSRRPATSVVGYAFASLLLVSVAACGSDVPSEPDASFAAANSRGGNGSTGGNAGATGNVSTSASRCNGTLGAVSVEQVTVPSGASCTLNGTRVRGDVKVGAGATLIADGARIDGNIQAEDALSVSTRNATFVDGDVQVKRRAAVRIENTTIDGNLQLEEFGASLVATDSRVNGDLQVKKANAADVSGTYVRGNIQLEENRGALVATGNDVRSNFQVFKNLGGVRLTSNQIAQALQCKENSPAPTGGSNVAGEKEDQCRAL
jgi:hypothetical protein